MEFETASGTVYTLELDEKDNHVLLFTGKLVRNSDKKLVDVGRGMYDLSDSADGGVRTVAFEAMPEIGKSFIYMDPMWGQCFSTPVVSIKD